MDNNTPMPWHENQWQQINSYKDKLPHALLLTGIAGLGKRQFSHKLAQQILCRDRLNHANACSSCRLIESSTNPDLLIKATAEGKQIVIEDIHEVRNFLQTTSHLGVGKVVVINDADKMNSSSANALLKILEEPPAGKYLILTSSSRSMILPTILSRCIKVNFPVPSLGEIQQWLQQQLAAGAANNDASNNLHPDDLLLAISGFSPIAILDLLQSGKAKLLRQLNQDLDKNGTAKVALYKDLELIEILDLLLWRAEKQISSIDIAAAVGEVTSSATSTNNSTKLNSLFALRSLLLEKRSMLLRKLNLNRELLLEECLLSVARVPAS